MMRRRRSPVRFALAARGFAACSDPCGIVAHRCRASGSPGGSPTRSDGRSATPPPTSRRPRRTSSTRRSFPCCCSPASASPTRTRRRRDAVAPVRDRGGDRGDPGRDPVHRDRSAPRPRPMCAAAWTAGRPGARSANMLPDSLLICGFVTAGYRYWRRAVAAARAPERARARSRATRRGARSSRACRRCRPASSRSSCSTRSPRPSACTPRPAHARRGSRRAHHLPARRAAAPARIDLHRRQGERARARLAQHPAPSQRPRTGVRHGPRRGRRHGGMPPMVLLPLVDYVLADLADAAADGSLSITVRKRSDARALRSRRRRHRGRAAEPAPKASRGCASASPRSTATRRGSRSARGDATPSSSVSRCRMNAADGDHR